jgi:hypothetical protein
LFEQWLAMAGTRNSKKKVTKMKQDNPDGIPLDVFNLSMFEELQGFQGFLLPTLARLHTGCRKQLFFYTRNAAFHGLARAGIKNIAAMGLMMKLDSYDKWCDKEKADNLEKIRFIYKQTNSFVQNFFHCLPPNQRCAGISRTDHTLFGWIILTKCQSGKFRVLRKRCMH